MSKVGSIHSAIRIRGIIAVLLQSREISNPANLCQKFKKDLSEDYRHQSQLLITNIVVGLSDEFYKRGLMNIEDRLISTGGDDLCAYGFFTPTEQADMQFLLVLFRKQPTTSMLYKNTSNKMNQICGMHAIQSTTP